MGRGWEWGGNASHTVDPWTWKLGGKGICSYLIMWVPLALEPAAEQNEWFSPCPPSGKEWRCPRHLLRSSRLPHLRVACVRAALSPLWTISGPAGTQGAPRSCERLDAPAYDSARGGAALEDTGGRPRRQADWVLLCGGAVHHAGARCVASVCFCTAENCWAQSSTVSPNSQAWETRASRKLTLSTSLLSARQSHRWRSWTTPVDIAFPRDCAATSLARRARSVAERSSCFNLGLVLPSCI